MRTPRLADMRSPETSGTPLVAVPVGSLEQHGPHLPLDTDTRVAIAVAEGLPGSVLAPAVPYGASGEHEGFDGTVSIGRDALTTLLVEHGRSICRWAQRVVFVNGHGGNALSLVDAVTLLRYEGRDVAWFACAAPGGDAHAGRTETSLLLHISPSSVQVDQFEVGNTDPVATLMPRLRTHGMAGVAPNGILGDPRGADATEGRMLLDSMQKALRAAVDTWSPDGRGRL